jgi:hypothetical protein
MSLPLSENDGIAGYPDVIPVSKASLICAGSLCRASVRNDGAGRCGLSPYRSTAWHMEHSRASSAAPRFASGDIGCAKAETVPHRSNRGANVRHFAKWLNTVLLKIDMQASI